MHIPKKTQGTSEKIPQPLHTHTQMRIINHSCKNILHSIPLSLSNLSLSPKRNERNDHVHFLADGATHRSSPFPSGFPTSWLRKQYRWSMHQNEVPVYHNDTLVWVLEIIRKRTSKREDRRSIDTREQKERRITLVPYPSWYLLKKVKNISNIFIHFKQSLSSQILKM